MKITKAAKLFTISQFEIAYKCNYCGVEFVLEAEDELKIEYESEGYSRNTNWESAYIQCPTEECKRKIEVNLSDFPEEVRTRLKEGIKLNFENSKSLKSLESRLWDCD